MIEESSPQSQSDEGYQEQVRVIVDCNVVREISYAITKVKKEKRQAS